jgi:hypothetical protein
MLFKKAEKFYDFQKESVEGLTSIACFYGKIFLKVNLCKIFLTYTLTYLRVMY